jgi:hypothetical protein
MSVRGVMLETVEALRCCSRCGLLKPVSQYTWKDKGRRRRQAYCRECMNAAWRDWYRDEDNRARHVAQVALRRQRRSTRHRQLISELKSQPCSDCGQTYPPYVMDFDHVADKTGEVSKFVYTYGTVRLLEEIERCDLVCANCHRMRTYRRRREESSG